MVNTVYYKYSKFNPEYFTQVVLQNKIYFSSPKDFNDPFDCRFKYKFSNSDAEWENYAKYLIKKGDLTNGGNRTARRGLFKDIKKRAHWKDPQLLIQLQNDTQKANDKTGIFCLSEVWDDLLMWSHYADSHRGICYIFKIDLQVPFFAKAMPINYSDEFPIVEYFTTDLKRNNESIDKMFLTKSTSWSYEKERRLLDYEGGPGLKTFDPNLLYGIIFGCRISRKDIDLAVNILSKRKESIHLFKTEEEERKFKLKFTEIYFK